MFALEDDPTYVAQIKGPEPYLVFKKHFLFKIILTIMLYDKYNRLIVQSFNASHVKIS